MRRLIARRAQWVFVLSLSGCMGYNTVAVPAPSPEPKPLSGVVMVTTRDGFKREMRDATITGDSIIGMSVVANTRMAVALQDVLRLETKQFQMLRTMGGLSIVLLAAATVALVLLIGALTSWD